jgi:hypothetical protein
MYFFNFFYISSVYFLFIDDFCSSQMINFEKSNTISLASNGSYSTVKKFLYN